ncbi:selenocysteine-specific translation elongation factor [Thermaerobacter subterraneus]|uniref:Selenocysteine-specific elongation factor n=1 Tax=Thermaerobacter subterraneus DSM 13965 TaxID=867903 RepID=K6P484_9FIRM|nr:selenocysteine-specific translation elongation factor [Thermaerobacter subterraneus]EKP95865.1 selenocysteine-specific translation elongation factor SelB [Thermaerobacter subterraneus DSM 13965]
MIPTAEPHAGPSGGLLPFVIGTAGHVDHGKTTLVRALTGVDTDRLQEEKRRGISIDLGFAPFRLPGGRPAAIVDVPGHERFIHNMVAGVHGMDLVLLVVAADEGVMPQTVEHLDILELLGVRHGLIAMTKVDTVDDPAWLDLVEEDIRAALRGTFLEGAPLVRVAPPAGTGLDRLLAALEEAAARVPVRDAGGLPRLPIDRVFTVTGFGTVVTGTLVSGTLEAGQRVVIEPGGREARIRQLQVHGRAVERAVAGQRVAVNLAGVDHHHLQRGQVVLQPGTLAATTWLAGRARWLPRAPWPLRHQERVRVHAGAAEVLGRVRLLEPARPWAPGEEGWVAIRLEAPLVVAPGDRFLLRTYSPPHTAGGGIVADTGRPWTRRQRPARWLDAFLADEPARALAARLAWAGRPVTVAGLARETGQPVPRVEAWLQAARRAGEARSLGQGVWIDPAALDRLAGRLAEVLHAYHQEHPLDRGMRRDALLHALQAGGDPAAGQALLEHWLAEGRLALDEDRFHRPGWRPGGDPGVEARLERLEAVYREAHLAPPDRPEAAAAAAGLPEQEVAALLALLEHRGRLVRVAPGLWLTPAALADARNRLADLQQRVGPFTVAEARDALGVTRKWALPLLEYFDRRRWTRRDGDRRQLLVGPADEDGGGPVPARVPPGTGGQRDPSPNRGLNR